MIAVAAILAGLGSGNSDAAEHSPRTNYLEHCGGCHGIDGRSAPRLVPDLKNRAGYFLCTREGREYVAQLPNVALVSIGNSELAALLNFVSFELGASSAPRGARRYTASEVAQMRRQPITSVDLIGYRRLVVRQLIASCGAPTVLASEYGPGP